METAIQSAVAREEIQSQYSMEEAYSDN